VFAFVLNIVFNRVTEPNTPEPTMSHAEFQALAEAARQAGDVVPAFDFDAPVVPATFA
jgi:hypothetical protein